MWLTTPSKHPRTLSWLVWRCTCNRLLIRISNFRRSLTTPTINHKSSKRTRKTKSSETLNYPGLSPSIDVNFPATLSATKLLSRFEDDNRKLLKDENYKLLKEAMSPKSWLQAAETRLKFIVSYVSVKSENTTAGSSIMTIIH